MLNLREDKVKQKSELWKLPICSWVKAEEPENQ
jgi:hypothetical protein